MQMPKLEQYYHLFDYLALGSIFAIGIVLAILLASAGQFNTAIVAVVFALMSLAAAGVKSAAGGTGSASRFFGFRGIDDAIIPQLKISTHKWLILFYTIPFAIAGFLLTTAGNIAFQQNVFRFQGSPVFDEIFSKFFAPLGEEYLFRGTMLPTIEKILGVNRGIIYQFVALNIACFINAIFTLAIHIFIRGGNLADLVIEFVFAYGQGYISKIFGILPAIFFHDGRNLAFPTFGL